MNYDGMIDDRLRSDAREMFAVPITLGVAGHPHIVNMGVTERAKVGWLTPLYAD